MLIWTPHLHQYIQINEVLRQMSKSFTCTHMHTPNTHTYTHTHACMHAHKHAHRHMHACMHTPTHTHTHTYARTHTCMHTRTHACTHTRTHARTHAHMIIIISILEESCIFFALSACFRCCLHFYWWRSTLWTTDDFISTVKQFAALKGKVCQHHGYCLESDKWHYGPWENIVRKQMNDWVKAEHCG